MRKHAVAISLILVVLLAACGAAVAEENGTEEPANESVTAAGDGGYADLEVDVELTDTEGNPIEEATVGDVVVADILLINWGPADAYYPWVDVWQWLDNFDLLGWDATAGEFDPESGVWEMDYLEAEDAQELLLYLVAKKAGEAYIGVVADADNAYEMVYDWDSIIILEAPEPVVAGEVPMQPTGAPLALAILSVLMTIAGLTIPRIK